jgi:hypothetical protein
LIINETGFKRLENVNLLVYTPSGKFMSAWGTWLMSEGRSDATLASIVRINIRSSDMYKKIMFVWIN